MGKQHFDLFTFVARALICRRCGNAPSHIASGFMDAASDLANRSVRAAPGFHRTCRAVGLSGSEDDGVGFGDVRTLVLEGSPFAAQWVAGWAAVFLGLFIPVEIVTRKAVVLALSFVPHRHMRLDVFFLHHPGQHRRGTVILGAIAAVATAVAGGVGGKIMVLIVGIIAAIVVAIVSIVIHVIIERAVAGGVTNNIPSIAPMVKVAANQVKWPFCEPDAFVLTDITYSGAIIFGGSLKLLEKFCIQERRLALATLAA